MKLLIILESHFFIDKDNKVWCDRIIDYNYLKRYLKVFEKVVVCGRTINDESKPNTYNLLVSGENVEFKKLPDFYGIKGILTNYFKLNKLIREYANGVDAAIYRAPTPLAIFTYKQILKCKKVLGIEFMFAADKMIEGSSFIHKFANFCIHKVAQNICKKANGVAYVTERVLQEKYPSRALLEGETDKYFTTNYSSLELDEKYIIPMDWNKENKPNVFKIIHVGYMDSYRKGQHTLIKALKIVKDKGFNVELDLIGDGKRREEFEKLVKDLSLTNEVKFEGLITDRDIIFSKLHNSHILVFPTEAEGLPRTIIEGMAVGLPCISSPVDGIPELLDDEFLVPYDNVNGYADKIIDLINDWEKMIKISNDNYEKSKKYEKSVLDKKRTDFYQKIYNLAEKNN